MQIFQLYNSNKFYLKKKIISISNIFYNNNIKWCEPSKFYNTFFNC